MMLTVIIPAKGKQGGAFPGQVLQAEHDLIVIFGHADSASQWSVTYTKYEWLRMNGRKVNRSECVL